MGGAWERELLIDWHEYDRAVVTQEPTVVILISPVGFDPPAVVNVNGPNPLVAVKSTVPSGGVVAVAGRMPSPATTATESCAVLPSESVTFTVSVTLGVDPAV